MTHPTKRNEHGDIVPDLTRVRLSLPQFWGLISAVSIGTAAVLFLLNSIKATQTDLANAQTLMRLESTHLKDTLTIGIADARVAIRELKEETSSNNGEWGRWRNQKDITDARQDADIRALNGRRDDAKSGRDEGN